MNGRDAGALALGARYLRGSQTDPERRETLERRVEELEAELEEMRDADR